MTRKDYKLLAEALKDSLESAIDKRIRLAVKVTAQKIADALATDNPRFNREKFLTACGVQ